MSTYLPGGTMQEGLMVREGSLVLLRAAAGFEVMDVLGMAVGLEAPDARKAVKIWKVAKFLTILNPLVFMIFFT